jgi:hypothetical protein
MEVLLFHAAITDVASQSDTVVPIYPAAST